MSPIQTTIFEATRGMRFIFLPNSPHYSIGAISRDMCQHLGVAKETLIGRNLFEAFPPAPGDMVSSGQKLLRGSLDYVLKHKVEHHMDQVRYDVQTADGSFRESYWDVYNTPVLDEAGEVLILFTPPKKLPIR